MMEADARGFVNTDGAEIFYQIFGRTGPDVLLLHGNGENYRCFSRQLEAFSREVRCVAIDSRGHGSSSMGKGELTIERMAKDAVAVMDELGIASASVVGFSDGGNIAIAMGLLFPDRVEKLVLAGANLDPEGVEESFQRTVVRQYRRLRLFAPLSSKLRKKANIMGLMVNHPHFTPRQLQKITQPALVLAGDQDLIRPDHTRLIAASLPAGRLRIIEGSDHFVFKRQPEGINRLVLDFIKEGLQCP